MSNSSLISYTKISPNRTSPRNHAIDTITIHCVVGQCSVESLGSVFASSSRQASSNYGIGYDGKIGLYVEEKDRSWCSSNAENDHRAITIEVASDTTHPYAVKNAAYEALIKLVADICKRNNIKKLVWSENKSDRVNHRNGCNMTVHRDFASKSCPGQYLYERHGEIAKRVNELLGNNNVDDKPAAKSKFEIGDKVKLVSGATYYNGASIPSWLFNSTLYVRAINGENITISTLQMGAITGIVKEKYLVPVENKVAAPVVKEEPKPAPSSGFKVGDEIKLVSGAKYTSGKSIPQWVIDSKLYVRDVQGDNVVFSTLKTGAITGIVNKKYIAGAKVDTLAVGDKVKISGTVRYANGKPIPLWVVFKTLYVRELQGDNAVISTLKTGAVTGTVAKKYLKKV